ncbi:MAG TPA: M14 family zinc carboxypeptidase, partial [Pyrinomonadaceae bacterium]|nr:M14 family zinc carboxypeptidase [Pyrinomonadaceae bacterium]
MSNADPDRLSKPIFHTYQQLRDDLDALRSLDRVAVVDKTVTNIGKSPDGNWIIPAIKIGKNPAHRSFICGNEHAREWISVEVPYLLAELLVKVANDIKVHAQFDRYTTQIKQLVKDREVWIVPMLNPEGNTFTRVPGRELWRKNRRLLDYEQYTTFDGDTLQLLAEFFGIDSNKHMSLLVKRQKGTNDRGIADWQELARHNAQQLAQHKVSVTDPTLPLPAGITLKIPIFGVDLNRNYPFKWNSQKADVKGTSAKSDDAYPGAEAGSEYEVQSVMKLFTGAADNKQPFQSALSYHSQAEIVLYPWGYDKKSTDRTAVVDFAGYLATLINQARNPGAVAEIKRAKDEFIKDRGISETHPEFLEEWSLDKRRQFYMAGNPGAFSFGGEGGSFMDWAHDKFDGMPVYTIELSPNRSAAQKTMQPPETDILPIFRENLPAALALIEYQNFQRQVRKRGSCYRCHFFSYAGPQTKGVLSQWTQHLQPFGDRVALTGEVVELFTTISPDVYPITDQARIRFDILEQDHALTGARDDIIGSLLGTGAK